MAGRGGGSAEEPALPLRVERSGEGTFGALLILGGLRFLPDGRSMCPHWASPQSLMRPSQGASGVDFNSVLTGEETEAQKVLCILQNTYVEVLTPHYLRR